MELTYQICQKQENIQVQNKTNYVLGWKTCEVHLIS